MFARTRYLPGVRSWVALALFLSGCGIAGHNGSTGLTSTVTQGPSAKPAASPTTTASLIGNDFGRPAFDPYSVTFVSASIGWAWGPGPKAAMSGIGPGVLARTNDYGRTWHQIPTPGVKFSAMGSDNPFSFANGVRFVNEKIGFLFGSAFYVTKDSGSSWAKLPSPGTIYDIEAGGAGIFALVNDCGIKVSCGTAHLYQILDNGSIFKPTGLVEAMSWDSKLVVQGSSVYVLASRIGGRGAGGHLQIWRSLRNGAWVSFPTPCIWFGADYGALAAWSSTGLALVCGMEPGTGNQKKMSYYSVDGGANWSKGRSIPYNQGYVASLAAANPETWILGEARGILYTTFDGGISWSSVKISHSGGGAGEGWGYVGFTTLSEAVAVPWTLNGSALAFSYDGAKNWTLVPFASGRT